MKILHFGAGKIGRGLIYPQLSKLCNITLVDSNVELVQNIRRNGKYGLHLVENDGASYEEVLNPNISTIAEASRHTDYDLITTSVIERSLEEIAPSMKGIISNNKRPLFIAPMENSLSAKKGLSEILFTDTRPQNDVHVLGTVIDRIIPRAIGELDLECERFWSIIFEDKHGFSQVCDQRIQLTNSIDREFEKKLLLVNGLHACTAYLGYAKQFKYVFEVMRDPELNEIMHRIGRCYVSYMVHSMNFVEFEVEQMVARSLARFSNPLKDPLARVGRNMMIKLSNQERVLRPLLYNKKHGLEYKALEKVTQAARSFTIGNDYDCFMQNLVELVPSVRNKVET